MLDVDEKGERDDHDDDNDENYDVDVDKWAEW